MFQLKIIFCATLFFFSILIGLTLLVKKHANLWLEKAEAITSGIFLGMAIFHLIPDALQTLSYTTISLLTSCSFIIFLSIAMLGKRIALVNKQTLFPWIIFLLLSIHSFIAGIALGLTHVVTTLWLLFIAIMAHKAFDVFAVVIALLKYHFTRSNVIVITLLFALMTPLGIIFGATTYHLLNDNAALIVTGVFDAIAAGSFLYIGFAEGKMARWIFNREMTQAMDFLFILLGFMAMGLLALWV